MQRIRISILAPRAGRDRVSLFFFEKISTFQSSRPVRGATWISCFQVSSPGISILAPRAGRDNRRVKRPPPTKHFNPRAPCGARLTDLPTHFFRIISILAPRAGRDNNYLAGSGLWANISILAPRAGRDRLATTPVVPLPAFQSSRPVRGATCVEPEDFCSYGISILAPRAGRDYAPPVLGAPSGTISILAPRAGRDSLAPYVGNTNRISILAPRAGRDSKNAQIVLHFLQ